ncbi:transcriptional regulator, AbrB family [Thermodesulfatator indicus DSM 15286]|uniref:Transcriptional regulator, AbrB family n=1 Tax=Thermodesulfatator indicus (strain DSM 15286 / JCM 11887 / CIR29812) TaxID=667014 RepID=F8A9H0_THEID|nr:AbrB/MazE/SpoVT family DNA-binding domain-containing protein [Thermodesulfatator indicus]AEH44115.1 transcriptional regulator, AbrB family [Thermodesulfatator indicus DSM 15286]
MLVTVTSKGQIVIPAPVRKKLNIQKGAKFVVSVEEDKIILEPVENVIRKGKGLLKDGGGEILKYLLEERKREAERFT